MTTRTNFIQKAIEILKRAIKEDNKENYKEAVSLYTQGIQYLMAAYKYEKNKKVKAAIKEKVKKYLTRAEQIQELYVYKYPSQQQIKDAIADIAQQKIHLIYGYTREIENLLNINYCIPNGIVQLCIVYYHIPIVYSPEDPRKYIYKSEDSNVKWNDVAGLEHVKQKLKEFVVLPLKFPALFTKRCPNVLLYGPPGTGKSFITKAVAHETNNVTFFNVSSADLFSKYCCEAEKMIKNVFQMARDKKPSIICFDEIDSFGRRSAEYPRRQMTEFLVQLQGVGAGKANRGVVVIGVTNCPWDVSPAVRRRLKKRIYFPLPEQDAREKMFRINIGNTPNNLSEEDYVTLGQRTNGYTGSDIMCIVQDTLMEPVRNIQKATHFKRVVDEKDDSDYKLMVCDASDDGAMKMGYLDIGEHEQDKLMMEPLEMKHFVCILERSKASVSEEDIERCVNWRNEFGEGE